MLLVCKFLSARTLKSPVFTVNVADKILMMPDDGTIQQIKSRNNPKSNIRTIALINSEFSVDDLNQLDFKVIKNRGDIISIEGPSELLPFVRNLKGVRYCKKPRKLNSLLDKSRELSKVDLVHDSLSNAVGMEIDGEGVIVGILDTEFDLSHPAFLNDSGKSRFLALWDFYPEDDEGIPSFAYSKERVPYGAAMYGDELNKFVKFGMGRDCHGTFVGNIAAGYNDNNEFYGYAPKAHLVGVKIFQDSDEVIDTVGNPFYQQYTAYDGSVEDGIEWIFAIADSMDMPCVINMSFGHSYGPHDGTSLFDRFIDSVSTKGRVIVGAAGNSGGVSNHIEFNLTSGDTVGTWVQIGSFKKDYDGNKGGYFLVDLWGEEGTLYDLQIVVRNEADENIRSNFISSNKTGEWEPDTTYWNGDTIIFYVETDSLSVLNSKSRFLTGVVSSNKNFSYALRLIGEGTVNGWITDPYKKFYKWDTDNFIDGDSSCTILEIGGTAKSVISVGAYDSKAYITNFFGDSLYWLKDNLGEKLYGIAHFSSQGPTIDGRIKPDVAAPGKIVVSAFTSSDNPSLDESYVLQWPDYPANNNNKYAFMMGTSHSAPAMTGTVALMLQVNPELDQNDIRDILNKSSQVDQYTSNVPNNQWGAGKLNALKAVELAQSLSPIKGPANTFLTANKFQFLIKRNQLLYKCSTFLEGSEIIVLDLKGRTLLKESIKNEKTLQAISLSGLSNQLLVVSVKVKSIAVHKEKIMYFN